MRKLSLITLTLAAACTMQAATVDRTPSRELAATADTETEYRRTPARIGGFTYLDDVVSEKLMYHVYRDSDDHTYAVLMGWKDNNDYDPQFTIPDYITYEGQKVPVEEVSNSAFYGGWGLSKVRIGRNVRVLGMSAFEGSGIESIVIPENVEQLRSKCFYGSSLGSVTFENAGSVDNPLVIGEFAFAMSQLSSFEIPARMRAHLDGSFTKTFSNPFYGCRKLRSISVNTHFDELDRDFTFRIIDNALCSVSEEEYSKVRIVAYPAAAEGSSLTIEGGYIDTYNYALAYSPLKSVTLKATNDIREGKVNLVVGSRALSYSSISSLNLDAKGPVKLQMPIAEYCNQFENFALSDGITNYGVSEGVLYARKNDEKYLVAYPTGRKASKFTVPDDVKHLAEYSFATNPYIANVVLPDGLRSIGKFAFSDCTDLTTVSYSGSTLDMVGEKAFATTPFLSGLPGTPVLLGTCLISYKEPGEEVILPESMQSAADGIFRFNTSLKKVVMPRDMKRIPAFMCSVCQSLTEVTWPENLEEIGQAAFFSSALGKAELPPSCHTIGMSAFADTRNLESVKIGSFDDSDILCDGTIGDGAFRALPACRTLLIGKGFRSIGKQAFAQVATSNSSSAETTPLDVTIPEGVQEIADQAFFYANVGTIELPASLNSLGSDALVFNGNTSAVRINRPTPPGTPESDTPADNIFNYQTLSGATLYIPAEASTEAFTQYQAWNFSNIERDPSLGSVGAVEAVNDETFVIDGLTISSPSGTPLSLYSLDGRAISHGCAVKAPARGIYIVRAGSRAIKVAL